jgi:hypothetical protein
MAGTFPNLPPGARWSFVGMPGPAAVKLPDPVGKSLVGTHPVLADLCRRVHQRHPTRINSARRSIADQTEFFNCAQARINTGRCPPECNRSQCASANPPGLSNHEFGLAVDAEPLDGRVEAWQKVVRQESGNFLIRHEPWHVQDQRVATDHFDGFPDDWRPDD